MEYSDQPRHAIQGLPRVFLSASVWMYLCMSASTCSRVNNCSGEGVGDAPKTEAGITSGRRGFGARVVILTFLLCVSFAGMSHLKGQEMAEHLRPCSLAHICRQFGPNKFIKINKNKRIKE